mgnify:CR=1 FL=1
MRYRIHVVLMWMLGRFVWIARSVNALQSTRRIVLAWLDDEWRHKSSQTIIEHCCRLLERCPKESRMHADLLRRRGFAFYKIGDGPSMLRFLQDLILARKIAEAYEFKGSTLGHIYGIFAIYQQQVKQDFCAALKLYSAACHELRGDKYRSSTLIPYATLLREQGDLQTARVMLEEAIAVSRNKRHTCCAHLELARVYHARKDLGGAHVELLIALRIARKHRYHDESGDIHRQLARLHADQKMFPEARLEALRAEECYRRVGSTAKAEEAAHMWREELRPRL